ncbi:MAG: phage tail length tape measure family protein [Pseudomonadota bacterium]
MALRDLFFSIFARDQTGTAFQSVNQNLRQTEGHAASLNDRMNRIGGSMQRMGAMGTVFSAGIVRAFRGSIDAYDQQARAETAVRQAIEQTGGAAGHTAEELFDMASGLQQVTRFGDEQILQSVTAQFLTFGNITDEVFGRAQMAALDLSTVLGNDLQSTAIMLGRALNDPVAGITALSRAGIQFTDTQRDMIEAMVDSGDVLGAQDAILAELERFYGGQAEAARDAGAGMREAWDNTWGDVKEIVGGVLLDILQQILPFLQTVAEGFQNMSPSGQRAVVMLGALAVALPPVTLALGLMATGFAMISGPVALVIGGIAALTAGVAAFWPEIRAAAEWITDGLGGALEWIEGRLLAFEDWIGGVSDALDIRLAEAAEYVMGVITILGDTFMSTFQAIPRYVSETVDAIGQALTERLGAILDGVRDRVQWVEESFAWLYDRVVGNSWVPDLVDEVGQHFTRLDGNMVNPTRDATTAVDSEFQGLFANIGDGLGTMAARGELTWAGFFGTLLDTGISFADRIISDVFNRLGQGASDAMGSANGLFSAFGGSGSGGGNFLGGLASGLGSMFGSFLGLDTGGSFTVSGRSGVDRNLVPLRLTEGEEVNVTRRGEAGQMGTVNVYIQTPDPQAFTASRAQIGAQIGRAVAQGQRAT